MMPLCRTAPYPKAGQFTWSGLDQGKLDHGFTWAIIPRNRQPRFQTAGCNPKWRHRTPILGSTARAEPPPKRTRPVALFRSSQPGYLQICPRIDRLLLREPLSGHGAAVNKWIAQPCRVRRSDAHDVASGVRCAQTHHTAAPLGIGLTPSHAGGQDSGAN